MLGDILLIEEKHKFAAAKIFSYAEKHRNGNTYCIAISGESGSGKSELAHCLSKKYKDFGLRAKILHTDNYYKILPELRNTWREQHGREAIGFEEYDWNTIHSNINSYIKKEKAFMPCVDILTNQVDTLVTDFSTIDVLILDGLYAIKSENINLGVFIDIAYIETKKAQIIREKEKLTTLREMVLEREHENVLSLKHLANIIVDNNYEISIKTVR